MSAPHMVNLVESGSVVIDLENPRPLMVFMRSKKDTTKFFVGVSKDLSKQQAEALMLPDMEHKNKEIKCHSNFWCYKGINHLVVKSEIVPIALINGMEFFSKDDHKNFFGDQEFFALTGKGEGFACD